MTTPRSGAEELRAIVRAMNNTREDFLDQYGAEELITIFQALFKAEFDILPDHWEPRQVEEALKGRIPTWSPNEKATYPCEKCGDEFGLHEPDGPCTTSPTTAHLEE